MTEKDTFLSLKKTIPKYKCILTVYAIEIKSIIYEVDTHGNRSGNATIVPVESGIYPIAVNSDFTKKYNPKEGEYYILDENNNKSTISSENFKLGYLKIN